MAGASRKAWVALFLFLLALPLAGLAAGAGAEIFVSPTGNDAAPGTQDQPVATLERARDLVRQMKQGGALKAPVRVILAGGTYELKQTFSLSAEDSGTTAAPVIYTAAPGATPVISGGRVIKGWQAGKINGLGCAVADLAAQGWSDPHFRELFVNGGRRPRPRFPKADYYRFSEETPKHDWQKPIQEIRFVKGDLKNWSNLQDVELVYLNRWFDCHEKIERIDEATRTVTFMPRLSQGVYDSTDKPARYWVENVKEAMDTPGQWYLDRPAGKLYYILKPGENMERTEVVAPALEELVKVGDGSRASNIRFEHLTFRHAEPVVKGKATPQAAVSVRGVITLAQATGCTFYDCTVENVGGYGIEVAAGAADSRIIACRLQDLGAGGVRVEKGSDHTILSDSTIRKAGRIWLQACGILVRDSGHNRIVHNEVYDLYYTAISCGWMWGYGPTATVDNRIEYNRLHDIGYGIMEDMGGIYTLGAHPGSIIRGNVIHDVYDYHYGGWGLYHDEGSAYFLDENNLTYRTNKGGFHQHYGRDNLLRNNIFATANLRGIEKSRTERIRPFIMDGNIIYPGRDAELLGNNWRDGHYLMTNNIYWREGDGPLDFKGKTFAEWQKWGQDAGSKVADPLFVDPTGGNFTLKPASPALAMGFKPFDPAEAGPRYALDPSRIPFDAWPKPDERQAPIVEWRLDIAERQFQGGGAYDAKIELNAQKAQNVVYLLVNRGVVPAKGSVDFRIEPAGAAKIEGESKMSYDLKPGEKAEVRFKVTAGPDFKSGECVLEAAPAEGSEGVRASRLYFN